MNIRGSLPAAPAEHDRVFDQNDQDTFAIVRKVYDAFGPERLMWGTDFPHVLKAGGYLRALELVRDELDFLNDQDKEWLFSKTVQRVWTFG